MLSKNYQVAAYYCPVYHTDPRTDLWHGKDWNEWDLIKYARPRFLNHQQPKVPLWGYEDEADPQVMLKKIDAAADHGITSWIFDWYWYDDGPFLQRPLDDAFLNCPNRERLQFSIMWANHDWHNIQPATRMKSGVPLANGAVKEETFIKATDHMLQQYFVHPNYWRVSGGLYVSIYLPDVMTEGFGGVANTRRIFDDFRKRVRAAGLGELHLNAISDWSLDNQISALQEENALLNTLGFDSITSYVWIHHSTMPDFPLTSYSSFRETAFKAFEMFAENVTIPFFPNVTMGWDTSPRAILTDKYENVGHPFMPVLEGNTPYEFGKSLERARQFLEDHPQSENIIVINAWNEWTEGSYLEPDIQDGMSYLEIVKSMK